MFWYALVIFLDFVYVPSDPFLPIWYSEKWNTVVAVDLREILLY